MAGAPPFKARELGEQVRRIPRAELELWLETLSTVDLGAQRRFEAHADGGSGTRHRRPVRGSPGA